MKNRIIGKSLVCGIIVLFLGMSIVPMAGSLSVEKHPSMIGSIKELNAVTKTGSLDYNITLSGTMGNNGWYVSCVGIGISGCGGCETFLFKIDGGSWFTYTAPFFVCGDGHHCVEAIVVDQYGNQTHLGPVFFKIDMTPPTVVLHKEVLPNKIRLTVEVWDNQSGVCDYHGEFYLDGALQFIDTEAPYQWTLSPIPSGHHTISVIVYDNAGNKGSSSVSTSLSRSQSASQPISQQINQLVQSLVMRYQMTNR